MFDIKQWADEFASKATDGIDAKTFLELLLLDRNKTDVELNDQAKHDFGIRVCLKRAEVIGLELTLPAVLYIRNLIQSPGEIVMYLSAIRARTKKADMSIITAILPNGKLSSIDLEKMWDAQKGYAVGESCDNCLDQVNWDSYEITNQAKPLDGGFV